MLGLRRAVCALGGLGAAPLGAAFESLRSIASSSQARALAAKAAWAHSQITAIPHAPPVTVCHPLLAHCPCRPPSLGNLVVGCRWTLLELGPCE